MKPCSTVLLPWIALSIAIPTAPSGQQAQLSMSERVAYQYANALSWLLILLVSCFQSTAVAGQAISLPSTQDCTNDTWTATSTTNAPSGRFSHTAVWTGSEIIVWGGDDESGDQNTGGRYNPSSDSWTASSTANAPTARSNHTAVWTGSEMIIWGGDGGGSLLNTGGRYNPITDSWTATSTTNAPSARSQHTAVWTGSEMIVWSGIFYDGTTHYLNTGGRYNPIKDSWTATSISNAPSGRDGHTAVWTGDEMIVWGGQQSGNDLDTGGRYNPSTASWTPTSAANAPFARSLHTAVWTGSEMIVWGGIGDVYTNAGGRYNPALDGWTATSTTDAASPRYYHTAVWTGSEMIVWGGLHYPSYLNTGGRYCSQPSTPVVQSAVSRRTHGSAGDFDIDLPLTGTPGIECRTSGATNDYTMIVTFGGNITVTGNPPAQVTLGTGCVGSSGTCTGSVSVSSNVVTVPLTNIANAQTIDVRINGVNSGADTPATDFTIPMSILIGDTNANGTVNTADVALTNAHLGQAVDATNFRSDVSANGIINAADVSLVKSHLGTGLP
jgi:N-acetylneuraminic acid mutarotase